MAFDHTFEDGEKLKYAALNIGGPGSTRYGDYCVVIKRDQSEQYSDLAFIKEDSLNYVQNNSVNLTKLSQDIANRESIHVLACIKHESDIKGCNADGWAGIICCDECYIEAITRDEILSGQIDCVRMPKRVYDIYYEYLFKEFISEISEMEKYQLHILLGIFKQLDNLGIKMEVVER